MPEPVGVPVPISRIVLTGFMGAGKTTVGVRLAERLGWRFVDSDRVVEARAGRSIAEIFEQEGEAVFREREATAIRDAAQDTRLVLALGGGALETAGTRAFLQTLAECRVIFLEAPLETMLQRCAGHAGGPVRPVLTDLLADRERLTERWSRRLPFYRQAHWTIATDGRSAEAVVDAILREMEGAGLRGTHSAGGSARTDEVRA